MSERMPSVEEKEVRRLQMIQEIRKASISRALVSYQKRIDWSLSLFYWIYGKIIWKILAKILSYKHTYISVIPTDDFDARMNFHCKWMKSQGWNRIRHFECRSGTSLVWCKDASVS